VNVVLQRGVNDDEVADFVEMTRHQLLTVLLRSFCCHFCCRCCFALHFQVNVVLQRGGISYMT
jgi:hypothetical protein